MVRAENFQYYGVSDKYTGIYGHYSEISVIFVVVKRQTQKQHENFPTYRSISSHILGIIRL